MKLSNSVLCSMLMASMTTVSAMAANTTGSTTPVTKTAINRECGSSGKCSTNRLSLSDEQLQKMAALKTQFLETTAPEKVELLSLKRQLKDSFAQNTLDRAQAFAIQNKINALRSKMADQRLTLRLDKFALLTPEQ